MAIKIPKSQAIDPNEVKLWHSLADANNQGNLVTFDDEMFPNWDLSKMEDTYNVANEVIEGLSGAAINQLLKSTDTKGMNDLFDAILQETYTTLFGSEMKGLHRNQTEFNQSFSYLDQLSDSFEETLRCEDVNYFITSVLPNFEMEAHHYEWGTIEMKLPRFAIIAARGSGKSFFSSNAVPAWRLYKYKGAKGKTAADRNARGFLFSFSLQQSVDLLEILKNTIEENDTLRDKLYNKSRWNQTDIICNNRARLTVKGYGSSVRGAHPSWIRCDDIQKDNILVSKIQREKGNAYLQAVIMNMIVPGGSVGIIGTPLHQMDVFGDLKTKKTWRVFEYPAIYPNGKLLTEKRLDYATIMEKKESQGNLIFSREILCKPIASDSTIFPIELLNNAFFNMHDFVLVSNRDSYAKKFDIVIVGCDFAMSGNVGADWSVYTVWGVDDDKMYLMYMYRAKGASYTEQIAQLKWINANFSPSCMMFENNNFQQIFVEQGSNEGLPVMGHHTSGMKNDLRNGWPGLAIMFAHGQIKIPVGNQTSKDVADMFISEFTSIAFTDDGLRSVSEHDDIVSSTYLSKQATKQVLANVFDFALV